MKHGALVMLGWMKAIIASYTQTVMQLDTKLAILKIVSWKQLCVVIINMCTFN